MGIIDVTKDPEELRMTVVAAFAAPVERVWQVWEDPRQLERWWGPPTYPATVADHDLRPGGTVRYSMTGPEGDKHHGWWRVLAVDAPYSLELEDGFGDDPETATEGMPTMRMRVALTATDDGGTRMEVVTRFPSREAMEQLTAMGMEEGMRASMGQLDDLLGG